MVLLDVAIGLTFLFVILGLFLTIFQELAASLFTARPRNLKILLQNLLACKAPADGELLFDRVKQNPLLRQICQGKAGDTHGWLCSRWRINFPSYLSAARFADVVFALVEDYRRGDLKKAPAVKEEPEDGADAPASIAEDKAPIEVFRRAVEVLLPEGGFRDSLLAVLNRLAPSKATPQEQLDVLRAAIGKWYEDSAARAAGWYKRKAQTAVFVYALLLSAALCVDTIHVARTLYADPELARAIADQAEQYVGDIAESEAASGYLTLGSAFVGTMLTIAEMDGETWNDPKAAATALSGDHLANLKFLYDHSKDDSVAPDNAGDCADLTEDKPTSLVLACLIQAIETNAPADDESASEADAVYPFPKDKSVVVPAIFAQTMVLRERSGLVTLEALSGQLAQAQFPIGWAQLSDRWDATPAGASTFWLAVQTIFGILLTALAASLGAPFWFDLLNKFIKLRGSGLIPGRTDAQTGAPAEAEASRSGGQAGS